MALGGGTFLTQNKVLPGAYINFVSKDVPSASLTDRGVIAFGFDWDWGKDGEIFELSEMDIIRDSMEILGYDYADPKLNGLKDLFKNATKVYFYKLNTGGVKASCTHATANFNGVRGNELKVVIAKNVDNQSNYDVSLYLGTKLVDLQTVSKAEELVDNAYVTWKKSALLSENAGLKFTSGENGSVSASEHQTFLTLCESYPDINAIGYAGTDEAIKKLYAAWVKNMRDKVGVKLQAVLFNYAADSEAIVNVKNSENLVYWATGVIGGTAVNASATNKKYDGNFEVNVKYSQSDLEKCIKNGEWVLHRVGNDIRVLEDINSLTTVTVDKGEIFKDNQTIRIIDQIAMAIASVFNSKYLGQVPNDKDGRLSLWGDITHVHNQLQSIRALQDFKPEHITVEQGDAKSSVLVNESITIVNTMERLYMSVIVG